MKELEVEMERLRLLVVALVEREDVGCASGSSGGTVDDKVGEGDEVGARESSHQPGRRLKGYKVTGWKETGRNETGRKETGGKTLKTKDTRGKETGAAVPGAKETGGRRRERRRRE